MTGPTDARIVEAEITFRPVPFRMPLKFGGRVVERTELINARVVLEGTDGRTATGRGSMPVGNIWAWPSSVVTAEETEAAMKDFAVRVADACHRDARLRKFGHPVDLVLETHAVHETQAAEATAGLGESIPPLARLVSTSPLDAAIHDAFGRLQGRSSFACLSAEFMSYDLSVYLDERFAGEHLDRYVRPQPRPEMPLYHLVGAADPLEDADAVNRPDDGLPVTLREWITADGLTHLKIKLAGDDLEWDVDRFIRVDAVAESAPRDRPWQFSADFNEKCETEDYVLDFLARIEEQSETAFRRLQYLEQPTHRDLSRPGQPTMHRAAAKKPVVIDESLLDYQSLLRARELGYSGVALKACKGQTESLLAAAAAQKFGMFLCVQDLTCPGASFLHSASLAAHIPTVTAIEGNGRQYCPAPNAPWAPHYPGLFDVQEGRIRTGELDGPGLGFALPPA